MKLGIMQPYIFPYIGYFQLVGAVDRFVAYDDVTFIKQGWINRNKILLNGQDFIFTVPLANASSFVTIGNTGINHKLYPGWRDKLMKTLAQAYAKAPHYNTVVALVGSVFATQHDTISQLATHSITDVSSYLGLNTEFVSTATHYGNSELKAKERVIDICHREAADTYINPIGGMELYSKEDFRKNGLELYFIRSRSITYNQFRSDFVPWLSIIDILMFNSPSEIRELLTAFDLV